MPCHVRASIMRNQSRQHSIAITMTSVVVKPMDSGSNIQASTDRVPRSEVARSRSCSHRLCQPSTCAQPGEVRNFASTVGCRAVAFFSTIRVLCTSLRAVLGQEQRKKFMTVFPKSTAATFRSFKFIFSSGLFFHHHHHHTSGVNIRSSKLVSLSHHDI